MCFVDLDPCELWTEYERKARKPHKCACCYGTIKAGEFYLVHFSVFEGSPTSEKMCLPCKADRAEFAAAHGGMMHTPSWVETGVRNCIGEGDNDEQWRALLDRILARRAGGPAT